MRKIINITFPDGSQKSFKTSGADIENVRILQKYPSVAYVNKKKIIERKKKYKNDLKGF